MNATETARLCRIIASLSPSQKFDEDTPAVWHAVLVDIRVEDALEAVKTIARTRPFISANDICHQVRTIRRERLKDVDKIIPNVDPDDPVRWNAERRAIAADVADGTFPYDRYAAGGYTLTGVQPRRALNASEPEHPQLAQRMRAIASRKTPPAADLTDGGQTPKPVPKPTVDDRTAAQLEAERERQLAALGDFAEEAS